MTISVITASSQGGAPAFSAYQSSGQSITNATWTKIQFQTKEYDTANCFDSTTNYRFTPNVAGYYLLTSTITVSGSIIGNFIINIYKNGAFYKQGAQVLAETGAVTVSALASANGTTDYFEIYVYQGSGASKTMLAGSNYTYFQGCFLRSA